MAILAWLMMGLALWHFAVFVPDKFWGGIVGALVGALAGAIVVALAINGFGMPGRDDLELLHAFEAVPGAVIGMALVYYEGARREGHAPPAAP